MELRVILLLILTVLCQTTFQLSFTNKFYGHLQKESRNYDETDSARYEYQTKTIDLPVDHFSFSVQDTFKLRYLINDTWHGKEDAPIFFYTGNEADIEVFAQNTGFIWDIAAQFEALVVFAEHRYYGKSMPYGDKSYSDPQHLGYLTSEQALADFIDLIQYLRSKPGNKNSPVIAFGGSYGGMLSAWIRMKYPHIVQGAIASSAPVLQFSHSVDCDSYSRIVTLDFKAVHSNCPEFIRKSWHMIDNITSTEDGRKWLSDNWKLCEPLKNSSDVQTLKSFLQDVYGYIAMTNYPYQTNFLTPLPPNPVNVVCKHLTSIPATEQESLITLHRAISVYTNFTGQISCLAVNDSAPRLGTDGWSYQACTEMVMPMCTTGVNDMFEPQPWNLEEYSQECVKKYSVKPQANIICQQYGCDDLSTATNIVFSNGLLDPWTSGGVVRNLSASAIAIIIPEGAHHLDLMSHNVNDPFSVTAARKYHRYFITKWIAEYRNREQSMLR